MLLSHTRICEPCLLLIREQEVETTSLVQTFKVMGEINRQVPEVKMGYDCCTGKVSMDVLVPSLLPIIPLELVAKVDMLGTHIRDFLQAVAEGEVVFEDDHDLSKAVQCLLQTIRDADDVAVQEE